MNFNRFAQSIFRSFRYLVAVTLSVILMFSHALPSFAAQSYGTNRSATTEATDQLKGIQRETDRVAASAPLNRAQTQARTERGLNEVQADADKDKMYRPSNSQDATTVKEQVKDFLDNVTGNN